MLYKDRVKMKGRRLDKKEEQFLNAGLNSVMNDQGI